MDLTVGELESIISNLVNRSVRESSNNAGNNVPLISIKKLTETLDISRGCVYDLIDKGTLTPVYLGGMKKPFFRSSDILSVVVEKDRRA